MSSTGHRGMWWDWSTRYGCSSTCIGDARSSCLCTIHRYTHTRNDKAQLQEKSCPDLFDCRSGVRGQPCWFVLAPKIVGPPAPRERARQAFTCTMPNLHFYTHAVIHKRYPPFVWSHWTSQYIADLKNPILNLTKFANSRTIALLPLTLLTKYKIIIKISVKKVIETLKAFRITRKYLTLDIEERVEFDLTRYGC